VELFFNFIQVIITQEIEIWETAMKILSWNVNGIRACMNKGFVDAVKKENPDIICIQETKAHPKQMNFGLTLPDYFIYWNSATKKGYSGVLTLTKRKPLSVRKEFSNDEIINSEGRFLQLEYNDFYLINLYFPNAQRELKRLDFKLQFNEELLNYIESLRKTKNIILCGDFNVAHKEIDLKNPKANVKNAGFSPEERGWFSKLLEKGYIDTFRYFYPDLEDQYTWWTYRYNSRQKNIGWRIDYFVVNEEFKDHLKKAFILTEIMGSDHCPIGLVIE